MLSVSQTAAVVIGAFYVFAGVVVIRAMVLDRVMNALLAALNDPVAPKELLKSRVLTVGAVLTLAGGVALALLSPLSAPLFAGNALWQGGYLLWAERALPPEDDDDARGRRQTKNAFVVYLAATAFVVWLALQGRLRAFDAPLLTYAIDAAIIAAAIAAVFAVLHWPRRAAPPAEDVEQESGVVDGSLSDIRAETPDDIDAIRVLTDAAFASAPHSSGTESRIIDALRDAGALSLSLVAIQDGEVVGHVAFSSVRINGEAGNWYGLGPVSVLPSLQRRGIGDALIREGLRELLMMGAEGCVLLGNPAYYARFGFVHEPALFYRGGPAAAFQCVVFEGAAPKGEVTYHPAFDVA